MGSAVVAHKDKESGTRACSSARIGGRSTPHASTAMDGEQETIEVL